MKNFFVATTLFAVLAFGANAQPKPTISVENAWARATPPAAQAGAVYVTITDHGGPDQLVGAATPVAGKADVHETIHDGNVMKMRPVAGLKISDGAPISMAPGGYHIMLTELKHPLVSGQMFPLTLRFEKAGTVEAMVTVKAMGAAMNMGGGAKMAPMDMPGMKK